MSKTGQMEPAAWVLAIGLPTVALLCFLFATAGHRWGVDPQTECDSFGRSLPIKTQWIGGRCMGTTKRGTIEIRVDHDYWTYDVQWLTEEK